MQLVEKEYAELELKTIQHQVRRYTPLHRGISIANFRNAVEFSRTVY